MIGVGIGYPIGALNRGSDRVWANPPTRTRPVLPSKTFIRHATPRYAREAERGMAWRRPRIETRSCS